MGITQTEKVVACKRCGNLMSPLCPKIEVVVCRCGYKNIERKR